MGSKGRATVVLLSLVVGLAGCSDDDVSFPAEDAGNDAAPADTAGPDISADTRVDADAGRDVSVDTVLDADAGPPDMRPPDADATAVDTCVNCGDADVTPESGDGTDAAVDSDVTDVTNDTALDSDDGSRDAVSEEPATCASRCASGVCDMNGDCTPCVRDNECTGGRVCNAGTCGPLCGDGGVACTGNLVCCTDHCVDVTRDPEHCGACATTCSATQFCGNASTPACRDNVIRNICNTKKATFLLDGLTDDDASSNVLKGAISTLCAPAPMVTSVLQTMSAAVNPSTGQPLAGGGELLVAAGGDSWNHLVKYLESSGTSAVYNQTDGVTQLQFKRRGGAADGGDSVLLSVPLSMVNPGHDYFLVYVVKDPISGTLSLVVYGVESPGTKAGAFYFANVMLPNVVGADVTTFTQAWYLYEWTAVDAGAGPSLNDTFTQISAGL